MYSGHLGDQYVSLDALTLAPKKHFSSFRFQLYFKKKYVAVAISDSAMHLIILKWLRRQKCRRKRKRRRQKEDQKKKQSMKVFPFI